MPDPKPKIRGVLGFADASGRTEDLWGHPQHFCVQAPRKVVACDGLFINASVAMKSETLWRVVVLFLMLRRSKQH